MDKEDPNIKEIIFEIKKKKELSGLADIIVFEPLIKYLNKNNLKSSSLADFSDRDKKLLVKEIRAELRLLHGRFQASKKPRMELFKRDDIESLLKTHSSTKERMLIYEKIKSLIKSLKVDSILDLGCGLNPIALADKGAFYYASDINESDLSLVNEFFKKNNIKGKVFFHDLRKTSEQLPEVDLCLLFKVFDIIENKGHKLAESILLNLKCKYLLVSFSTKKLSGKSMHKPKRVWFEKLLSRISYKFSIINEENEIFYLVEK